MAQPIPGFNPFTTETRCPHCGESVLAVRRANEQKTLVHPKILPAWWCLNEGDPVVIRVLTKTGYMTVDSVIPESDVPLVSVYLVHSCKRKN